MCSVARVLGYLMAVLIGLAATVIAVLFSVQSPAAAIPVGANVTIHTDDAPGYDAHENYTAPERGPPADLDTTYDPDGPRSLGVLTRPHTPIAPSTHDYDDIAPFVHTAGASQRVEEPDGDPESSHAVVQRLQVAANSVRPAVTDARLGRALADDFRGRPNPVGDGSALDAARHTVDTGDLVGGSTHLEKAVEMRDRYARILRRGGLSTGDQAAAQGRYDAYSSFVIENDLDAMMRARGLR